MPYNGDRMIT